MGSAGAYGFLIPVGGRAANATAPPSGGSYVEEETAEFRQAGRGHQVWRAAVLARRAAFAPAAAPARALGLSPVLLAFGRAALFDYCASILARSAKIEAQKKVSEIAAAQAAKATTAAKK